MPEYPKRREEVMGHRTRKEMAERVLDQAPGAEVVEVPAANEDWHQIALRWYSSLEQSGQSRFYEPSDWALAYYVAETMSKTLHQEAPSPTMFKAVMDAQAQLLATEGSRRKLRLELLRVTEARTAIETESSVAAIADYKKRLRG